MTYRGDAPGRPHPASGEVDGDAGEGRAGVTDGLRLGPLPTPAPVSVVVPARDAADTLAAAVTSALDQVIEDHLEVVVAVGPSRDSTRALAAELAAEDPHVRVVDNPAGTTPAGLNAAIAASHHEVVVRLDAHAQLPPGYVARATTQLRSTGAVNVGGRQVPVAEGGFAAGVAAAMTSPAGAGGAAYRTGRRAGPVDTVYLGVFRRQALAAVGGFDERLVRNQDYELNLRLRAAGGTVWFDPELRVAYRPRDTVRGLWRQYHGYGRWKRAVAGLHPGTLRLRQLAAPALVAGLPTATAAAAALDRRSSPLPVVGYLLGLAAAGAHAAPRPALAPATSLALGTMHLAWGTGFLRGGIHLAGRSGPATAAGSALQREHPG